MTPPSPSPAGGSGSSNKKHGGYRPGSGRPPTGRSTSVRRIKNSHLHIASDRMSPSKARIYHFRQVAKFCRADPDLVWRYSRAFPSLEAKVLWKEEKSFSFDNLALFLVLSPTFPRLSSFPVFAGSAASTFARYTERLPSEIRQRESLVQGDESALIQSFPEAVQAITLRMSMITFGQDGTPTEIGLYRQGGDRAPAKFAVTINPEVNFGKPVIAGRGIDIEVVRDRFDAGDSVAFLAKDYCCELTEVEDAIRAASCFLNRKEVEQPWD